MVFEFSSESFKSACRDQGPLLQTWLQAFDRQHGAALYREAAGALGNWHLAQDVVQDGMVKVWLRCATYTGPGHPIGWIRKIIRNTLLDHLEAHRPQQPLVDEEGQLTPEAEKAIVDLSMQAGATPESSVQTREVQQVYMQCFARFAKDFPAHAQVLRWVVDEGLSSAEVEALIDRSPGATREFISQARKKARTYLKPWYDLVRPAPGPAHAD